MEKNNVLLVLEQLEDRIFLDANPVAAVGDIDHPADDPFLVEPVQPDAGIAEQPVDGNENTVVPILEEETVQAEGIEPSPGSALAVEEEAKEAEINVSEQVESGTESDKVVDLDTLVERDG